LQWTLVVGVAFVLAQLGLNAWILPAIIFIVGVHFLPLAAAFKAPRHYITGIALVLLAVVYPFVVPSSPADASVPG